MKNILKLFKINIFTYIYFLLCLITGYIKESLIIFLIIIIHELGHLMISLILHYKVIKCELYPFGGLTLVDKKINVPLRDDLLIYCFGIINQIIVGLIVLTFTNDNYAFLYYNKIIILFNLIPIYPLDGFHILLTLLQYKIGFYKSLIIMKYVSILLLIIFSMFNYNQVVIISFLIIQNIYYFKNIKNIFRRFLLERFLYHFSYKKITYFDAWDISKIRRDCLTCVKCNNYIYNERYYLVKIFDINPIFW